MAVLRAVPDGATTTAPQELCRFEAAAVADRVLERRRLFPSSAPDPPLQHNCDSWVGRDQGAGSYTLRALGVDVRTVFQEHVRDVRLVCDDRLQ